MRIGILSMQRIINYGSFWQAYLLMNLIKDKGHDVEFIDIIPGKILNKYPHKSFAFYKLRRIPYYLFFTPRKKKIFKSYQKKYLGCPACLNFSSDYDCIFIGSDEVFNFSQPADWGFSRQLFGEIDNKNVNTYAASFGSSTYKDIEEYNLREDIIKALSNLRCISLRDENSSNIISRLLPGAMVYKHLDPVLIGDLPIPERKEIGKKYIAVYAYDYRFDDKDYIRKIMEFARRQRLKIYSIGFYQDWVDKNVLPNPFQLLEWFVNAEYVLTDTFHGTVFSIRCRKQFVTIIREEKNGNQQKLGDLLARLNLKDRQLKSIDTFEKILFKKIDYGSVEKMLFIERKRTEQYLDECI